MQANIPRQVRELQPESATALARAQAIAWDSVDPALLELCRCRVLGLLQPGTGAGPAPAGVPAPEADRRAALDAWQRSSLFSPLERAALAYTEQYVLSVSSVSDAQVQALREHLADAEVYAFAAALYVIEMGERLRLVSSAVLGSGGEDG